MAFKGRVITIEGTLPTEWARSEDFHHMELPRPVALVNGAFDVLHFGHMRVLHQAKLRSATLVVALDSDAKVHESKGPGRPVMTFVERATTLSYMSPNYIVEISTKEDMDKLIEALRPDFRVQGADYVGKSSRYPDVQKLFVRRAAGAISTSEIIRRCHEVPK